MVGVAAGCNAPLAEHHVQRHIRRRPRSGACAPHRIGASSTTGTWLYALNQKGDSIVQFSIDQETGELTPTGNVAEIPTPVSLVFTTGG
jgi:6-phosphogluconolactonase (cycloisomerase 2 family)